MTINPVPYNKTYEDINSTELVTIDLRKIDFESNLTQNGRTDINFSNCTFNRLVIENHEEIQFKEISIHFSGCYIENLLVNKIASDNISFSFSSSVIRGGIGSTKIKQVHVQDCISQNFVFHNQRKLTISLSTQGINILLWRNIFKRKKISHTDVLAFGQNFSLFNCQEIDIHGSRKMPDKNGVFRDKNKHAKYLRYLYNLNDIERAQLKVRLDISVYNSDHIPINIIRNVEFDQLKLNLNQGETKLENCTIEDLVLANFTSKSDIQLYNIKPISNEGKLSIHRCNFENARFDNVEIDRYHISFYRSNLAKIIFSSCSFPKNYKHFDSISQIEKFDDQKEHYYKNQYEMLLQLKAAFDATGNYYESQKIQSISMEALKKADLKGGDKLILSLNWLSNNHGLSICRPFILFWVLLFRSICSTCGVSAEFSIFPKI